MQRDLRYLLSSTHIFIQLQKTDVRITTFWIQCWLYVCVSVSVSVCFIYLFIYSFIYLTSTCVCTIINLATGTDTLWIHCLPCKSIIPVGHRQCCCRTLSWSVAEYFKSWDIHNQAILRLHSSWEVGHSAQIIHRDSYRKLYQQSNWRVKSVFAPASF